MSQIDIASLDDALPHGFSIAEDGTNPEVYVGIDPDHLIQVSLIGGSLGDGQVDAQLTSAEAVQVAMALLALAESNR